MDVVEIAHRFFEPLAFAGVFGGAFLTAALRSTRADLSRAIAALGPLVTAKPEADALAAVSAVRAIERVAQARGIMCADRVETAGAFLRRATFQLADAASPQAFAAWAEEELDGRRRRHAAAAETWRTMADAAPAMGMIGTVIGLVQMFAAMDDPAAIGPAMALALLTTLYGVIAASLVAGPIAARLERLSALEDEWQRRVVRRLEALAGAEATPHLPRRPHLRSAA